MAERRLFEDDVTLDGDVSDELRSSGDFGYHSLRHLVFGLAVAAVIFAVWLMFGPSSTKRASLTLIGAEAGQLRPGAAVVLNGRQVGEVEHVALRDGLPMARLRVDPDVLQEVPSVASEDDEGILGSGWARIHERLADQSIVPTRTPLGFYIVLFVVVAMAVLLLGLVIKLLKSTAFWAAVFIALIVVVVHAWHTGKLDETPGWGHDHPKASQTTGAQSR